MKIQIKNKLDLSVIFECEVDSIKLAVELAVNSGLISMGLTSMEKKLIKFHYNYQD